MKNLKYLFVLLLTLLVLPLMVYADSEEVTSSEEPNKVNIYLFRGEGCPHCADVEDWVQSVQDEYGYMFNLVDYEVWNDEDNAALMDKVAEARGEEVNGVPYVIIGNKSWNGYIDSYGEEMLSEIKSEYEKDANDRYDIMKLLPNGVKKEKEKSSNDVLALILILVVVGGVCFGVYKARDNTN